MPRKTKTHNQEVTMHVVPQLWALGGFMGGMLVMLVICLIAYAIANNYY